MEEKARNSFLEAAMAALRDDPRERLFYRHGNGHECLYVSGRRTPKGRNGYYALVVDDGGARIVVRHSNGTLEVVAERPTMHYYLSTPAPESAEALARDLATASPAVNLELLDDAASDDGIVGLIASAWSPRESFIEKGKHGAKRAKENKLKTLGKFVPGAVGRVLRGGL